MKAIFLLLPLLTASLLVDYGTPPDGGTSSRSIANAATSPQTVRDVAVVDVQATSSSVLQGDSINIEVTVQNLGTTSETFTVSLRDDTDLETITQVTPTLGPGQTLAIGLLWDTSQASIGGHQLTATVVLAGDQDPANDSMILASAVNVGKQAIVLGDGTGLDLPDAFFGASVQNPQIDTQAVGQAGVFVGNQDAKLEGRLVRAAVGTADSPVLGFFVANADATFQPSTRLQDPFRQGEVKGCCAWRGSPPVWVGMYGWASRLTSSTPTAALK